MDEPDGINEVFRSSAQIALTAAGVFAERAMRAREQAQRKAQAASEQEARELEARLTAERGAARASLAPLERDDWWAAATPDDLAVAWETARTWEDIDPDAQRAVQRMRDELRTRWDIDGDAHRAAQIADVVRTQLATVSAGLPRDEAPPPHTHPDAEAARIAAQGQLPLRSPGSPLPPATPGSAPQPLSPPNARPTPTPARDAESREPGGR